MLTYPSNYEKALQSPFEENWLFQLHSDDTGSNFIGLSFSDTTVDSVFYYGSVLNRPSIRESINLDRSVAKTTNLSITIPNFNYNGSDISTQLLNRSGSTHYLNYPVKIYSQLNSATALSDCLQVFNGRLRYVSMSGDKIQLQIVSERPWDNIDIPNVMADNGVLVPIAYGDYTGNTTSGLTTSKTLYPAPIRSSAGNTTYFLTTNQAVETANACFYDKSSDLFPNLTQNAQTATLSQFSDSKYGIGVDRRIIRTFRMRANAVVSATDFNNTGNAYDSDNTTYADDSLTTSGTSSTRLRVQLPKISGKVTAATMYLKAEVTLTHGTTNDGEALLADDSFGASQSIISSDTDGTTTSTSGSPDPDGSGTAYTSVSWTTAVGNNNNELPEEIKIELQGVSADSGSLTASGKVYDIYVVVTSQNDYGNEPVASAAELGEIDKIYIGSDGKEKSWSSGTITKIHHAHRDLIHRYTGWGVDGSTYTTPENWSSGLDIETERSAWPIRWWLLKATSLRRVLEKLQYEGGFISRFRANASLQYIVIPGTPSATDTLGSSDVKNLNVSHVAISDIKSKMHIAWNKHPAKDHYFNEVTLTDGGTNTTRTRLNITKDLEGVSEVKLDAYADASSAQRFFDYYNGLVGDVYIKIDGEIVNPLYYKLEVGDQIAIDNNYPYAPFGESWSGKVFMVTSTARSTHSMKFSARQIN